jgi:lipopolysaccharide transport system permease protein/teichoic acid transport system permease protein
MLAILLFCMFAHGMPLTWHVLACPYYLAGLAAFALGLSWLLAAINVFFRDVREVLGVVLNLWFWFTPVVWGIEIVPERFKYLFQLNPMYHIVTGYRGAFLYRQPPWHEPWAMAWFWVACAAMFFTGAWMFRRLKPEFPEAL